MFWYLTNTGRSGDGIVTLEVMERECGDSISCNKNATSYIKTE